MMIDVTILNGVATLLLNRPERRNALCTEMMQLIEGQLKVLSGDDSVRALVISGGGGVLCAGSDLKELAPLDIEGMGAHQAYTASVVRQLATFPKPVLVAVEGYALGGGCALALAADLVVAAETARLSMPEVANGWIPPWGLTVLLQRCRVTNAQRIVWGAEHFSVKELHAMGAVDHVTIEGEALEKAQALATDLARLPAAAVASTKRFVRRDALAMATDDEVCSQSFMADCASQEAQVTFQKFFKKGV